MPIKHTETKDIVILSYSAYSVYKQCPQRYYLEKIARVKSSEEDHSFTIPGLVAHSAAEEYLKTGSDHLFNRSALDASIDAYSTEEFIDLKKAYGSIEKAKDLTSISAENLYRFLISRNIRNKKYLTEEWFGTWDDPLFLSPNLAIQGAADLIEVNENSSAILYDFKATRSTKNLNKDQLILYSLASELKFGIKISMCSFFLLPANKHEYFRFTKADQENLVIDMQQAANNILSKGENLPFTPSEKCERCQYFSICKAGKGYIPPIKQDIPKVNFGSSTFGADL